MSADAYREPFGWWGPVWSPPAPRSVLDLIDDGVLSADLAAVLWALLARRASIVVAAGPAGAGKTTLLTALLDFLPPGTRRVYVRGCYESFGFLTDPAVEPRRSVLLVNEISAHLPIYLWGPGVRRLLGAARAGFAVAATAHATSVEELVYALAGYPLRVPVAEIAAIDLVLLLDAWTEDGGVQRQVRSLAALRAPAVAGGGLVIETLAAGSPRGAALRHDISLENLRYPGGGGDVGSLAAEVAERTDALSALRDTFARRRPDGGPASDDHGAQIAQELARLGSRWVPAAGMG
jgi:hypothetical protein